jgi:hypothetical protein
MPEEAATYLCPECGQTLTVAPDRPNLLVCSNCGAQSFVPDPEPPAASLDYEPPAGLRNDDLDAARIRRLAVERRSLNRTASYFVVAAGACCVMIAQLGWMTIRHVRVHGWTPRPIGFLIFILLAAWGGLFAARRAMAFRREARQSSLSEPSTPPDLSTLQDGSQRFEHLL